MVEGDEGLGRLKELPSSFSLLFVGLFLPPLILWSSFLNSCLILSFPPSSCEFLHLFSSRLTANGVLRCCVDWKFVSKVSAGFVEVSGGDGQYVHSCQHYEQL